MELDLLRQVERSRKKGTRQRWITSTPYHTFTCICICICIFICICVLYSIYEPMCIFNHYTIQICFKEPFYHFRNVRDSIAIVGITKALIIGGFFAISILGIGKVFQEIKQVRHLTSDRVTNVLYSTPMFGNTISLNYMN